MSDVLFDSFICFLLSSSYCNHISASYVCFASCCAWFLSPYISFSLIFSFNFLCVLNQFILPFFQMFNYFMWRKTINDWCDYFMWRKTINDWCEWREIDTVFQEFKQDLNVCHIYIVSYYEIRENLLFISLIKSFIVIALSFYNIQIYVEGSYIQK
jgi:hypothetical protein